MKLLITGAWNCTAEQLSVLKEMGNEILFMQNEGDALPQGAEDVEGIICNGLFLHHDIQQFQKLRYVQLTSAGFDRVPLDYIQARGIEIHNARGVYSIPMAEFAMCGVLQLYKQMRFFIENQKRHRWEKHRGLQELNAKTVCIIGCGSVGTECAKRFCAFGCKVIGVDICLKQSGYYETIVPLSKLDDILPQADIIVLTLPLTEDTEHLIDRTRLSTMNRHAILVNIARGAVVDTEALIEVLPNIGGAVLDVVEDEPLKEDSLLWDMDNVIVTPHNSFVSDETSERLAEVIIENLEGK